MRKILLSTLLLSFFLCKARGNQPSFIIEHDANTNKLSLWKSKKRKPNVLKKIRSTSFYTFSSDIGTVTNQQLKYSWIDAAKNDHKILVKAYHHKRPNDIQTKLIKTRKPIKLELNYRGHISVAPGILTQLYIKMYFDDNTYKYVNDLENSFITVTSEGNRITNNGILIPSSTALNKKSVKVKATYNFDSEISQSIKIPINYEINREFKFNGKKGYSGSNIHLAANGGDGSDGIDGADGERGDDSSDSRPAADGYPGGHGGNGGNGGDGGAIEIYYEPSLLFVDIKKLISISNVGGKGGRGGNGGFGGRGGRSDDNKKALEILFNLNGGNTGRRGTNGNYGANGRNGLLPRFTKLNKKEIDRVFEDHETSTIQDKK